MESFIVAYIPSNDAHDIELRSRILAFPCSVSLSKTTYLIGTDLTVEQVFERVAIIPHQDQVYVLNVTKPYCGQGSRKADEWLHSHLSAPKKLLAAPPDLIR